jgi:gliding motility-associated-like protein
MVEEVIFVTRSQPSPSIDTVFTDLSIVTTPAGRYTTAVNGNLIPVDSFHTIPGLEDRYWFARFFYTHDAPEVLHVTNPLGFSASMNEFAYYMGVRSDFWNSPQHYITHIGLCRSGGNGQTSASLDALEISPVRCAGDTLFLQALNNYFEYQTDWYIGDSVYLNREEVAFPLMQANDSLTVQLIIHRSCPDTITKTIFVEIPPTIVFLPADTVICQGSAITVSSPNATHFLWSDGVTGSTRFFDTSGTFTVTASNSCQTQASATVELRFFDPLEVNLGNDTNLCRLASLLLDATHPQASFYEWQDGSTGATYTVYYDGEYWVKLTDPCTSAADSINVTYFDRINLQLGNDTLLCEGQVLILNATTPVAEYQWSSGYTGAIQEVYASGTYSVTVSNPCHTVSASVKVSFEDCSTFIFLPNAITPNGDGVNDVFKPQFNHPEEVLEYEIVIYNRWGNLLFCSRDFTQGWSGDTAPDGVYVYRISYKTRNAAKKEITGTVTVVR